MSRDQRTDQENELNRLPSWLRGMDGAEETPAWLRQLAQSQEGAFEADESKAALDQGSAARPDWMSDFRDGLAPEAPEEEALSEEEAGDLPGWFTDVEEEAAEPEGEAAVPDWLKGFEPEAAQPEQAGDVFEATPGGNLPGWLSGFEKAEAPQAAEEPRFEEGEAEIPDWLRGVEPAATEIAEPQVSEEEQAIPGWLLGSEGAATFEPEQVQPELEQVPDWLRGISAPVPEEQPPAEGQEEMPDWMREGAAVEPAAESSLFEQEEALPDWLSDIVSETGEKAESEVPSATPDWMAEAVGGIESARPEVESGLPDWLSGAAGKLESAAETAAADQGALPDWLQAVHDQPTELEAPGVEEPLETPDWLLSIETPEGEAEAGVEAPLSRPQEIDMPDWLKPTATEEVSQESQAEEALPDWLSGAVGEAEEIGEPEDIEPVQEAPFELEADVAPGLPDWLQNLGERPTESEVELPGTGWLRELESAPMPQEPLFEEESSADIPAPAWLDELEPGELEPEELAQVEESEEAGVSALPGWLQTSATQPVRRQSLSDDILSPDRIGGERDLIGLDQEGQAIAAETGLGLGAWGNLDAWIDEHRARNEPVTDSTLSVETGGPLAGLRGLLTPEPLLGIFPKSTYKPTQPIPDAHVAEARLVESILSAPAGGPVVVGRAQAKEVLASLGRWVIYLALIGAMVAAAFLPKPFNELIQAPEMNETSAFYDAIERLPQGGVALLALDYDAALDGELTPQVQAIVRHLSQRGISMAAVSITAQGVAIVEDVLAQESGLVAGEDYLNLGYLPPHPASLQALLDGPVHAPVLGMQVGPAETPLGLKIASFEAIDLIITVSGSADHVRWWVEQVGTRYQTDIIAGVSASIAPYVLPFYHRDNGQVKGLLVGLAAAADYEQKLVGGVPLDYAQRNLALQGYGQLMLVAILLLSGITFALRRRA